MIRYHALCHYRWLSWRDHCRICNYGRYQNTYLHHILYWCIIVLIAMVSMRGYQTGQLHAICNGWTSIGRYSLFRNNGDLADNGYRHIDNYTDRSLGVFIGKVPHIIIITRKNWVNISARINVVILRCDILVISGYFADFVEVLMG